MRESIMRAYQDLGARNLLEEGCNPIRRRPLIVTGYDTEVMIDVMEMEGDDDESGGIGANVDSRRSAMVRNQEVRLLSSQILHLRRELCDARTEGDRQITIMKRKLARLSNNLTRFANRPGISGYKRRRLGNVQGGGEQQQDRSIGDGDAAPIVARAPVLGGEPRTSQHQEAESYLFNDEEGIVDANVPVPLVLQARLTKCPRSLYDLWKEYEFGFQGCKPAKDWTASERGKDRFKYYKRNIFWVQVSDMIRAGHTAERAIDLIYRVYGANLPVTKIIKKMIDDKKIGGHPALRTVAA
jgi:hypothetical protein